MAAYCQVCGVIHFTSPGSRPDLDWTRTKLITSRIWYHWKGHSLWSKSLCFFIFFSTALTSAILMQSAGPSLTSADILWSHSFSSFISFSIYSFHEFLIPLSFTITFPDAVKSSLWSGECNISHILYYWHSMRYYIKYHHQSHWVTPEVKCSE